MKAVRKAVLLFLLILPVLNWGQQISGRVSDQKTGETIPYVNVGVVGGDRGTVSDESGYYLLDLTGADSTSILRFSFIGYESHDIVIADIGDFSSFSAQVQLTPMVIPMKEVVVFPREYEEKYVGNPNPLDFAFAGFANDSLGYEAGIRVKIKARPTILKQLRLHGLDTSYDTVFYRLNVYEMDGKLPGKNVLREPIYVTLTDNEGIRDRTIDLTPYHIVVHDDFVITLEYIQELGEGDLRLKTGFLSGKIFYRRTSQAEWHSAALGYGMSVLIRYQK